MTTIIWLVVNNSFCLAGIVAVHGCRHGDVRLVGGTSISQGRVEVCVGQAWGTVCHYGFDSNDARVVCRQLGYNVDKTGTSEYIKMYNYIYMHDSVLYYFRCYSEVQCILWARQWTYLVTKCTMQRN